MNGITGLHRGSTVAAVLLLLLAPAAVLADEAANVAALDAQCEAARQAQIKPLREAAVAKCQADGHNDADYCVRYWSDYGNAKRLPNGTMSPRMFDDMPICVAAVKARKASTHSGQ